MNRRGVIASFAVLVVAALVAWLSGYNFDYRSEGVAIYAFVSLCYAAAAYVAASIGGPK